MCFKLISALNDSQWQLKASFFPLHVTAADMLSVGSPQLNLPAVA